ncbi:MAG TPA: dephospho-CoA kinase [Polyangia bacterium]|nr:dephospho-CoA kinase [Polyangia bacterium]
MRQLTGRGLELIGLTGGIASGKSTVARLIAERGIPVLDADQLARDAVEPGQPALAEIARRWPQVIGADGRLDRRRLGAIVFADPGERAQLEAILHPRIAALAEQRAAMLARQGHRLAFYEASLLVETGRHRDFDGLVVVTVSPETQLARAVARGGLERDEARARIAAQLPLSEKVAAATHVIDNEGSLEATAAQVTRLLEKLAARGR